MTRNMNFHRTVIKLVSSCISCLLVCIVIMIEFWWLSYHLLTGMVILFGFWCHSSCLLTCWGRCYYCALLVHLCFIFVRFFGMAVLWDSMVYTDWKQLHIQYNLNGSNPDGSFTLDDSNSFFQSLQNPSNSSRKQLFSFFSPYFIMELYVVCTH